MMNRASLIKITKLLVIIMCISVIFSNIVVAAFDVTSTFTGDIDSAADGAKDSVQNVLVVILTAVRVTGMGIAIIMLITVGIKIMMASPSERANIKQYSINYVIGAFVLLGASALVSIVQGVAERAFQ